MLDDKLFQQRLANFTPEPLTPSKLQEGLVEIPFVNGDAKNIDLAKINYLDVLNNEEIKKTSEQLIREYGVGTCGPRAFYGTTDLHLELEEALANFLQVEESIVYAYGFVAISSSIAAYCKKSDVVFIDEKANFPTHQGLVAARSKVVTFSHNDPQDLKRKVHEIVDEEKVKSRKFLIIEGISWATGKLCPLPDFITVAEEFKMRIFLEESYTLGVFGDTGRGLTEYYNIDPSKVDMIFGTLEGAIGSIGGFCAGSNLTIEHQRLSGTGYIFSASLPTYLVKVVLKSLELLKDRPREFNRVTKAFHHFLTTDCKFNLASHPEAPFKLITYGSKDDEGKVYQFCKSNGVHFIHNENGLMVNLNVNLLEDEERLKCVHEVFRNAAKLVRTSIDTDESSNVKTRMISKIFSEFGDSKDSQTQLGD